MLAVPAAGLLQLLLLLHAAAAQQLFVATHAGYGVAVHTAAGAWVQPLPLEVETTFRNGSSYWTRGAYAAAAGDAASGTLVSPGGAIFHFVDTYTNATAGFSLARVVTVVAAGADANEYAFATRFSLPAPDALAGAPRQLFIPGVAYQNATALPRGALAGDPLAAHILVREDRLPLPFALLYFPDGGDGGGSSGSAQLVHARPDGGTIPNEDFTARIVDAGLQFGSIGVVHAPAPASAAAALPHPSLAFQFPGSEGDRTYVYNPAAGWANRSHPIAPGVARHAYELLFRVAYRGVPSVPFEISVAGAVVDTSSQMGFVGRALPCAALLRYDAVVAAPNASRRAQADAVADLWAAECMNPCGVPKTWYDVGEGSITWRPSDAYQGSIRIMSDGMLGLLDAWGVAPAGKDAWLAAARRYADFLVDHLAADGSIATAWDWTCAPLAADTRQTPHIIPFLVAAFAATRDARYRDAALAAGAYSAALFEGRFSYEGGAVDNPDVPDKEAGWLAAQAFIALYELTGNASWLGPAAQAATYAETFVYAWDVPIPCTQAPPTVYPCRRTTLGASLIATGQSGADNYMAIAAYDFRRLGGWLADDHFMDVAAFLEAATTQVLDWDGSLGYAARGLMTEAATFSVRRGAGVADWLPWLTVNVLHPIVQQGRQLARDAAAAAAAGGPP